MQRPLNDWIQMQQNKAGGAPPPPLAAASQDKNILGLDGLWYW